MKNKPLFPLHPAVVTALHKLGFGMTESLPGKQVKWVYTYSCEQPARILTDMLAATQPAQPTALREALEEAEELLGFHQGSSEKMTPTGEPVVWVNNEDLERVLAVIRNALKK